MCQLMHVASANVYHTNCLSAPACISVRESSGSVLLQEAEAAAAVEAEQRRSEERRMQQVNILFKWIG